MAPSVPGMYKARMRSSNSAAASAPIAAALLFLLGGAAVARPATAQVFCNLGSATVDFGSVSPFFAAPVQLGGSAPVTCTNPSPAPQVARVCLEVGTGNGGTLGANRAVRSGSSRVPIEIRSPPGSPSQVGQGTTWPRSGPLLLPVPAGGFASASFALAVTLLPPGAPPPPGAYDSIFNGSAFRLVGTAANLATCPQIAAATQFASNGTLSVRASFARSCAVSATAMNFGARANLSVPADAVSTVSLRCNGSGGVRVSLDNGANGGTGPTARRMAFGGSAITYGIFRDSARAQPWGSTVGVDVANVTGTNGTVTVTAYGRVPAQPTPPPGTYVDTVLVTATW